MEVYIKECRPAGLRSLPVGAGFFFVEKKDKTLRPCSDYRSKKLLSYITYLVRM